MSYFCTIVNEVTATINGYDIEITADCNSNGVLYYSYCSVDGIKLTFNNFMQFIEHITNADPFDNGITDNYILSYNEFDVDYDKTSNSPRFRYKDKDIFVYYDYFMGEVLFKCDNENFESLNYACLHIDNLEI